MDLTNINKDRKARRKSSIDISSMVYGKVPPQETLDYLLSPVCYHYAAKDRWVTKQEVETLAGGLAKYGKPGIVYTYPEADHSFCNEARPAVYRPQDAALAWQRTTEFLSRCF